MEEASDVRDECVDFGSVGKIHIFQLQSSFNERCRQEKSCIHDCTGLRVYTGAHILLRFLTSGCGQSIITSRRCIEIGCGTGVVGILARKNLDLEKIVLTDGSPDACTLAKLNIKTNIKDAENIDCCQLLWGLPEIDMEVFLGNENANRSFDIVLGSDLMYYRTAVSELISTVMSLTRHTGLFIHAHIFRSQGQDTEMIDLLASMVWKTLFVPLQSFLTVAELGTHPEWYSAACLISGPSSQIDAMRLKFPHLSVFEGMEKLWHDAAIADRKFEEAEGLDSDAMGLGDLFSQRIVPS